MPIDAVLHGMQPLRAAKPAIGGGTHSAVAPESFTTLAHLTISVA